MQHFSIPEAFAKPLQKVVLRQHASQLCSLCIKLLSQSRLKTQHCIQLHNQHTITQQEHRSSRRIQPDCQRWALIRNALSSAPRVTLVLAKRKEQDKQREGARQRRVTESRQPELRDQKQACSREETDRQTENVSEGREQGMRRTMVEHDGTCFFSQRGKKKKEKKPISQSLKHAHTHKLILPSSPKQKSHACLEFFIIFLKNLDIHTNVAKEKTWKQKQVTHMLFAPTCPIKQK